MSLLVLTKLPKRGLVPQRNILTIVLILMAATTTVLVAGNGEGASTGTTTSSSKGDNKTFEYPEKNWYVYSIYYCLSSKQEM